MKIKEILIYIGIIILILVGGYLKKDQINIIEGNVGHTGGTLDVEKLSLKGCEKKCDNTCTCKQYLWKKSNPKTEKHDCTIINSMDQLITDKINLNDYEIYNRPDRPNYTTRKYKETIPGSYSKGVAEMKCRTNGLVLATPQEVKEAENGSTNLGEGWTTDGIKNIRNSEPINVNKSKSNVHCSTNPETICNDYLSWKDHHHPRRRQGYMSIDWQGNYNNTNVITKGYAQTKDLCKYRCWEKWGDRCKLIEWNKKTKECRTSNKMLPHKEYDNSNWFVSKMYKKPGLKS